MTFQQDLNSLIAEIDQVLPKASSRLAWLKSSTGDVNAQRRVLEQVRKFLVELQKKSDGQELAKVAPNQQPEPTQNISDLVREINSLRDTLIKPLQADIEALRQQRESLANEVRQIEAQRQYYNSLGQQQAKQQQIISEFAQALMGHLQESLTRQITHTLGDLKTQVISSEMATSEWGAGNNLQATLGEGLPSTYPLPPQERLELIRQMQAQSDRLLINLDGTIRTVLETLQHSIYAYQESLSSGVTKMHSLGQQSEILFTNLADRIAQHVIQDASINLEPSALQEPPTSVPTTETIQPEVTDQTEPTQEDTALNTSQQQLPLPFPGMELPSVSIESPQLTSTDSENFQPPIENTEIIDSLPNTDDIAQENQQFDTWEIIEELELGSLDIEAIDFDEKDISDWQLESVALPAALSEDLILEDAISIYNAKVPQQELQTDTDGAATDDTRLDLPIDATANLNQPQPTNLPIPSLSNPQEQNSTLASSTAAQTTGTGTDLQITVASNQQPNEVPEEVQTVTALTDLFDDMFLDKEQMLLLGMGQELSSNDEESSLSSDVITQYIPQLDIESYPDVEDSYIPASPDEHLFVKDESERELDINLWLDENTIQQLGKDLSSFESIKFSDVPVQKPLEQEGDYAAHSARGDRELPLAQNGSEEKINLIEPWQLLTSNDLLGEDWQDFEVEGYVEENYSPNSTFNSTATSASTTNSDVSAYDITQLPIPNDVPQNTGETTLPTELDGIDPPQPQAQQDMEMETEVSQQQSEPLFIDENSASIPQAELRLSETLDTLSGSTLSSTVSSDQSNNYITSLEALPKSENALTPHSEDNEDSP